MKRERAWNGLTYVWTTILFAGIVFCSVGAVFGYIKYFRDDGYRPEFAALELADTALNTSITQEAAARLAEDMNLMTEQAVLNTSINAEITTRTEQDAYLEHLVVVEVANRTAEEQLLADQLQNETNARIARDVLFFSQLLNISRRINVMLDYDVNASQMFSDTFANMTSLAQQLVNETLVRITTDMQHMADDVAIANAIANFTTVLNNEITTRVTAEATLLNATTTALNGSLLTINTEPPVNHAFNISSANAGYTIGSGGGNVITIQNNALHSLGSLTSNVTTGDIDFAEGNNMQITTTPTTVTFALRTLPPGANFYRSTGALVTGGGSGLDWSGLCAASGYWNFDAICFNAAYQIQTYSPSPDGGNSGFIFPDEGVYMVEIRMHIVANMQAGISVIGQRQYWSMAVCVNTRAFCKANPASPGIAVAAYGMNYQEDLGTADLASCDLQYFDVLLDASMIISSVGRVGQGVYPQWTIGHTDGASVIPTFNTMYVTYEVTKLQSA